MAEIQTTKLTYHTYPLPDAIQPHVVLKGIPLNVPVDEIQADLTVQKLWIVKISHLIKTDKATQTLITKYPVLSLFKLALTYVKYYRTKKYVTTSYDGRSISATSLYVNSLTANLLTIHPTSVVSPPSVSNVNNHMQRENANNPLAHLQNMSTVAEPTQPILPTVLHINN